MKLVMVMIVYPVMLLTLQLWLTDSFLKDNKPRINEIKSDVEIETNDGFSGDSFKNENHKIRNDVES